MIDGQEPIASQIAQARQILYECCGEGKIALEKAILAPVLQSFIQLFALQNEKIVGEYRKIDKSLTRGESLTRGGF